MAYGYKVVGYVKLLQTLQSFDEAQILNFVALDRQAGDVIILVERIDVHRFYFVVIYYQNFQSGILS